MTTQGQKRKRSIQDTPVDLTKMQMARTRLLALQEELNGVQETEAEMKEIMKHVDALQTILGSAKKLKLPFSSVRPSDLSNMGLSQRSLRFNDVKLDAYIASSPTDPKHIQDLCNQIIRIRRSAGRRFRADARMILDAVLLTIADISFDAQQKRPVAIFPGMRIASADGVLVQNAQTKFEVWLSGNTDYGICTYQYEEDRARVLQASFDVLKRYAKNCITMVQAKHENEMLGDSMPEVTSQAIALSEVTGNKTVRYCLSDGRQWMFAVYTVDDQGNRISYDGPVLTIMEPEPRPAVQQGFEKGVQRLVEVLYHWLTSDGDPRNDALCTLE